MAIGPRNKLTTTGLMNQKPNIPAAPDLSALGTGQPQQVAPANTEVANTEVQAPGNPLQEQFPDATPMEMEFAERVKSLTDEDQAALQSVLSPSVKTALVKIIPEFKEVMDAFGSDEPNVIFPLSTVAAYAMQRYGGDDVQEAVNTFIADVTSLQEQQMENQNNVPPGTGEPTETTGLMTSPQNMETV